MIGALTRRSTATASAMVADPHSATGGKILVTVPPRDDPIGRIYAHRHIDDARQRIGVFLLELFELAGIGSVPTIDLGKEAVDGGGTHASQAPLRCFLGSSSTPRGLQVLTSALSSVRRTIRPAGNRCIIASCLEPTGQVRCAPVAHPAGLLRSGRLHRTLPSRRQALGPTGREPTVGAAQRGRSRAQSGRCRR